MKDDRLDENQLHYLKLLSKNYPTMESAAAEIINLQAVLNIPKGTEHFVSDIHGEYHAFSHVLRNASGVIKDLIQQVFGDQMRECEKKELATLIYYPDKKLALIEKSEPDMHDWYRVTLNRMIRMARAATKKNTWYQVRKALPGHYAYIMEEMLRESEHAADKQKYYDQIIETIIRLYCANDFIQELSKLIRRLAISRLHVIGDIFDRGKDSCKIMDMLMEYHSLDIQWGNHDMSWMGAAAGCPALVCNVIRIQAKYGNLETLEEAYGINLLPLASYAVEAYKDDPCTAFMPDNTDQHSQSENELIAKMHKAVAIMQFKYEAAIIKRHPEFNMDDRILLDKVKDGKLTAYGYTVDVHDFSFPGMDSEDPLALTEQEQEVLSKLVISFSRNEKLQTHVRFLFNNGSLYTVFNGNLLFHGSIPMNDDGTLKEIDFRGEKLKGKELYDAIDRTVREGFFNKADERERESCLDLIWYLWCGEDSPLFGKKKMTTFERYFVSEKALHHEERTPYYKWRDSEDICKMILADFGLDPENGHMINGHVPVQVIKGEKPVKAGGKLFVIDGGFSKAYQGVTGIAGYTLIYNSHGLVLVSHEPFTSVEDAVKYEKDILSATVEYQHAESRVMIAQTDQGKIIQRKIDDLEDLLYAYHKGQLSQRT